jgi:hypothetical protein
MLFNTVCDHQSELTSTEFRVWTVFWRHANVRNHVKMLSRERIAGCTGLHVDTIDRACRRLFALGLLKKIRRGRFGEASEYLLTAGTLPQPCTSAGTVPHKSDKQPCTSAGTLHN